jgi:hypothetical protein
MAPTKQSRRDRGANESSDISRDLMRISLESLERRPQCRVALVGRPEKPIMRGPLLGFLPDPFDAVQLRRVRR